MKRLLYVILIEARLILPNPTSHCTMNDFFAAKVTQPSEFFSKNCNLT